MRAGTLRHKITFQSATDVTDNLGGYTRTWSDTYDCFAAVWPLKGTEALEAMKLEHKVTHKIRVRYRDNITADMRIKFGSRYFDIVGIINPDERDIMLDIMATESVT